MKRNTLQKRIILDALREMNCHASAGMVYAKISADYPTISLGTVYRVLTDAAASGELLRLHFTTTDDRFDITLPPHPHVVCSRCGFVDDVAMCDGWDSMDNVLFRGRDPGCAVPPDGLHHRMGRTMRRVSEGNCGGSVTKGKRSGGTGSRVDPLSARQKAEAEKESRKKTTNTGEMPQSKKEKEL